MLSRKMIVNESEDCRTGDTSPLCSRSFPQINIYVYLLTFVLYKLVLGRFVLNVLERLGSRNEMARELEI